MKLQYHVVESEPHLRQRKRHMKRKIVEQEEPIETLIDVIAARKTALSFREFAEMLSMSYTTIWEMVVTGRLPAFKIGGAWRLDPQTTAAWLRQRFKSSVTKKA
jgi:excisionase family DNA binding protein